jgi:hypothetical protein
MNDLANIVLFADIADVVGVLITLLVPIVWVIKQIAEANKQAKQREMAQPAAAGPAEQPARRQAAVGQQADPLRNQVEEFLRRAGRGPQAERARPAPREIEVLIDKGSAGAGAMAGPAQPAERLPESPRQVAATPLPAQVGAQQPARRPIAPRKRKTLAERATERAAARASKLAEQTSHLGRRIIAEDQQFDVQLKAKFDHAVGTLAGSAVTATEQAAAAVSAAETPAAQIAAMLASPDGVRQAIVVNEILRRPTELW